MTYIVPITSRGQITIPAHLRKSLNLDQNKQLLMVKAGDTLRTMARRYYGDPNQWEKIYDANREKVERGLPSEGALLLIPAP